METTRAKATWLWRALRTTGSIDDQRWVPPMLPESRLLPVFPALPVLPELDELLRSGELPCWSGLLEGEPLLEP